MKEQSPSSIAKVSLGHPTQWITASQIKYISFFPYPIGASEVVLDLCNKVFAKDGTEQPLADAQNEELMGIIQDWASQGLRSLSLTYTRLPPDVSLFC